MRRNPVYTFKDLDAVGIYNVPMNSTIQINDADSLTPGAQPLIIQIIDKYGINSGSTIGDFLGHSQNYTNANETTTIYSELEKVQEGSNAGWRLLGKPAFEYAAIGKNAIDLSHVDGVTTGLFGASGDKSLASGYNVQARGAQSQAFGTGTITTGDSSLVFGKYNVGQDVTNIAEVGIGVSISERKNALEIKRNGDITVPSLTTQNIDAGSAKSLVTKEYVNAADLLKLNLTGGILTGNLTVDGASILCKKGLGFEGNIKAEGYVGIGQDQNGNSSINFNSTSGGDQAFYFDNTSREFKVREDNSRISVLWHNNNQGSGSGLDADLLDGMQPDMLPISIAAQSAIDLKFDKVGGTITGNVQINNNLSVQGQTSLSGDAIIPNIIGNTAFRDTLSIGENLACAKATTTADLTIGVGALNAGKSILGFTDTSIPGFKPVISWDNSLKEFQLSTNSTQNAKIWHSGVFNPDSKLNVSGGLISGDLDILNDFSVSGITTLGATNTGLLGCTNLTAVDVTASGSAQIQGNLNVQGGSVFDGISAGAITSSGNITTGGGLQVQGAASIQANLVVDGSITAGNNLTVDGSITSHSVLSSGDIKTDTVVKTGLDLNGLSSLVFKNSLHPTEPAIYFDGGNQDFRINFDISVPTNSKTIWHSGNLDPETYNTFGSLQDTESYTGNANKYVVVKPDASGLTYINSVYNDAPILLRLDNVELDTAANTTASNTNADAIVTLNTAVGSNTTRIGANEVTIAQIIQNSELLLDGTIAHEKIRTVAPSGQDTSITIASEAGNTRDLIFEVANVKTGSLSSTPTSSITLEAVNTDITLKVPTGAKTVVDTGGVIQEVQTTTSGATTNRPLDPTIGLMYFDTDLGLPVWCSSNTTGANTWVDATGTVV